MNSAEIITFDLFDSITIYNEDLDNFRQTIVSYLETPRHLVINLAFHNEPSDDFLDIVNFLSTILKTTSHSLQVFAISDKIQAKLKTHRYRNILTLDFLSQYINFLSDIEREIRVESLLKSYVDECMKHLYFSSFILIKRGELSIETSVKKFFNEMNYFQIFKLENCYFSFVIGGDESFFSTLLEKMKLSELSPVLNNIVNNIPKKFFEKLDVQNYLAHPYTEFPREKVEVLGQKYDYFSNCSVMRIPLECEFGTFYIEVWIPNSFSKQVYRFLNP